MALLSGVIVHTLIILLLLQTASARHPEFRPQQVIGLQQDASLQTNVTWDEHSLFINGNRILIFSGELHPFRLPVPTLWLDVLQKIRALGFSAVSFYVDWALVEGTPGEIRTEGVFALEPFFEAAKHAGIYLIARPGPYINAEVSGGGFPGWLQRVKGHFRTTEGDFLEKTDLYVRAICEKIAKAQITNGGPVILVQPENEYSHWTNGQQNDPKYIDYVNQQFRKAGIVVPLISNDAAADGNNVPGKPGAFDIYGHDGYPLGFDCSNPDHWDPWALPTDWRDRHESQSPTTPYTIPEFQGGSFDPWGGSGFEKCVSLTDSTFERVFWKNLYSFGVSIYNVYMIYGGTNWGNIGHPNGYTSYDYGAVISEDRRVSREKYSEAKLQANFLAASPAYLTAIPQKAQAGGLVSTDALTVTRLQGNKTQFLVVRHTDYTSQDETSYKLVLDHTSIGPLTIPFNGKGLTLHGRDSKIHVIDYDLLGINMLYSTAEIFTVQKYGDEVVLVVYGGPQEEHEMAIALGRERVDAQHIRGQGVSVSTVDSYAVFNWQTSLGDKALKWGALTVWFLDRQSAYNCWVLGVVNEADDQYPYAGQASLSVFIKGGYLMRTASISGSTLKITGDINATTTIEIIAGAPKPLSALYFNGEKVPFEQDPYGIVTASLPYRPIDIDLPNLAAQTWYYIDSLPELQDEYSDTAWVKADLKCTNNSYRELTTPTSLFGSDYGFHTGTLIFRGHFQANGHERKLSIHAQGGNGFGFSVWLNSTFLGSLKGVGWSGDDRISSRLPKLEPNASYVITVVIDSMGYDENFIVGLDTMRATRGILDYSLDGQSQNDVMWKVTGNLGGEQYYDKSRGPLNEGGLWAERHGFHLPGAPVKDKGWKAVPKGPVEGITRAGVAWYVTSFDLNVPQGYDVPIAIQLPDIASSTAGPPGTSLPSAYRVQLYVNGWQFGEYVHHLGPQTKYPVPEGVWDYNGTNWVAISLWAMDGSGARLQDIKLVAGPVVQTGYTGVKKVEATSWTKRRGAY
ncbi:uncharacterized protein PV09_02553 [Verruconis gallopava]|uniref:Beta-galactosidase n=1 Tax=Verruconis gallopava TaxID=253628 RepID=A0A0D1Z1S4_9PEZI|nr:uncharacterized protein PV09_02553 [Verruconis gallopava]KIW06877.1 hypothetical protein PV09_02553 [Verruconis gallopava]